MERGALPKTSELRSDCERCAGLCCVAPGFSASADFAIDKPHGEACPNLTSAFTCRIHSELRSRGFPGCCAFECYGAGQKVVQVTFGGKDWRSAPEIREQQFAAFRVQRELHELLMYLDEAIKLRPDPALREELESRARHVQELTLLDAAALAEIALEPLRSDVHEVLTQLSALVRGRRASSV